MQGEAWETFGDLGGDEAGGADLGDLGGDEAGGAGAAPAGGEDDNILLAEPPAKRDLEEDGSYITPGAKGKRYTAC